MNESQSSIRPEQKREKKKKKEKKRERERKRNRELPQAVYGEDNRAVKI